MSPRHNILLLLFQVCLGLHSRLDLPEIKRNDGKTHI